MHKIEWNDAIKIGFEEIDNQHYELIEIYNELCDAIDQYASADTTLRILRHLGHYTSVHFATEEALLRVLEYPEYETHKEVHDKLIAQLRVLTENAATHPQGVNMQLLQIIKQWLSRHILETDAEFVPYLLSRGLSPKLKKRNWLSKFNLLTSG